MKKLAFNILLLLLANTAFAGYGFFGNCATFIQLSGTTYKVSNCTSGDPDFNGNDLGTVTTLTLEQIQAFTYQNGNDNVMNTRLYYRIYPTGSPSGSFVEVNLANREDNFGGNANDTRWHFTPGTNLLSGLSGGTTYQMEIYYHSEVDWNVTDGNKDADIFINNGGSNYKITFTADAAVPVELSAFTAKPVEKAIGLNWSTSSEENNAGFEIQKSIDGKDFEKIGFVAGNGNSLEEIQYQFIDNEPNFGTNYYRLKQMDFDGNFEFTDIINIDFEKELQVDIFPNPTREKLTIQSDFSENIQVQLINISGQIIYQNNINNKALEIDLSAFANGVYLLKITKGTSTILNQKVVKF